MWGETQYVAPSLSRMHQSIGGVRGVDSLGILRCAAFTYAYAQVYVCVCIYNPPHRRIFLSLKGHTWVTGISACWFTWAEHINHCLEQHQSLMALSVYSILLACWASVAAASPMPTTRSVRIYDNEASAKRGDVPIDHFEEPAVYSSEEGSAQSHLRAAASTTYSESAARAFAHLSAMAYCDESSLNAMSCASCGGMKQTHVVTNGTTDTQAAFASPAVSHSVSC